MPGIASKSPVAGVLKQSGVGKAFDKRKADETKFPGGGDLPAGIEGGVAQLVAAKLDIHKDGTNKGKVYMYLAGVVQSPEFHEGQKVQGRRTNKTIGLYDKPGGKSQEEQVATALNEMRKLGVDTKTLQLDDWETALLALEQAAPYFLFRTWKGPKQTTGPFKDREPQVQQDWKGKIDNYVPGETVVVDDHSGDTAGDGDGGDGGDGSDTVAAGGDETDWLALAAQADPPDDDAETQQVITDACKAAGLDPMAYQTWKEAAEALIAAQSGGGAAPAAPAPSGASEPWKPREGDFYQYRPKGARKDIDVEVTKVFASTCNVKKVSDQSIIRAVPYDDLDPGKKGK